MIEVKINSNDQNKRLDKFVKKILPKAPSSFIYKLFRKNDVKVNKKPKPIDYVTQLDDVITIYVTKDQEIDFKDTKTVSVSKACDFKVIYEDENIIIVDKDGFRGDAGEVRLIYKCEQKNNFPDDE